MSPKLKRRAGRAQSRRWSFTLYLLVLTRAMNLANIRGPTRSIVTYIKYVPQGNIIKIDTANTHHNT